MSGLYRRRRHGGSLGGAIAAQTTRPVIGVPIDAGPLQGFDALLSTVQMPGGIPVAAVAIGKAGAKNAGYLAVQMMALSDPVSPRPSSVSDLRMLRQLSKNLKPLGNATFETRSDRGL